LIAGLNFKAPADFPKTHLHSEYSESDFPRAAWPSPCGRCGHASAKIFDLQDHLICLSFQHDGIQTPRVVEDIRESFVAREIGGGTLALIAGLEALLIAAIYRTYKRTSSGDRQPILRG